MIIIAMLEPGCHVRHARFHPWSLVPTPPARPSCIIDQYMCSVNCCIVKSVVLSSVTYFGPNFSHVKTCSCKPFTSQSSDSESAVPVHGVMCCGTLIINFPPEPSASDNCHSSAFSSPARASTSSSASLCHILSWDLAYCTICTVHIQYMPLVNHPPPYRSPHCEPP